MKKETIGFALTGSFCTFAQVIPQAERLIAMGYEVIPIFSEYSATTDTRFGKAKDFITQMEGICGNDSITALAQAEPIGPRKLLDILLIAPCTGNTLGKLAHGITDTSVTMAAKSHLRNGRPVLIAPSTNDALGGSAKNIGQLLNYKNIFFVPLQQDDPEQKPRSMISDFDKIPEAVQKAMLGLQMQPVML